MNWLIMRNGSSTTGLFLEQLSPLPMIESVTTHEPRYTQRPWIAQTLFGSSTPQSSAGGSSPPSSTITSPATASCTPTPMASQG